MGQAPIESDTSEQPLATTELAGLVVWVTGASRGLGRAIAGGLAAAGADVAVTARTLKALDAVRSDVERTGSRCHAVAATVQEADSVDTAAAEIVDTLGRIDVLVNCAGISPSYVTAERVDEQSWREVIDVNLTGTFLASMAAGRVMLTHGSGSIINVSSIHGRTGAPRLAAYCASKGGVDMLTRALGQDWTARGVRVNAVAPGYFETDMTAGVRGSEAHAGRLRARIPMGRFGAPDELVGIVRFLSGPASSYVSGTIVNVDGGWGSG